MGRFAVNQLRARLRPAINLERQRRPYPSGYPVFRQRRCRAIAEFLGPETGFDGPVGRGYVRFGTQAPPLSLTPDSEAASSLTLGRWRAEVATSPPGSAWGRPCGTPVAALPVTGRKDMLLRAVENDGCVHTDRRVAASAALTADGAACRVYAERYLRRARAEMFLSYLAPLIGPPAAD